MGFKVTYVKKNNYIQQHLGVIHPETENKHNTSKRTGNVEKTTRSIHTTAGKFEVHLKRGI